MKLPRRILSRRFFNKRNVTRAVIGYAALLGVVAWAGAELLLRSRTHWVKGDFVAMRRSRKGAGVLLPPSQETLSRGLIGIVPVVSSVEDVKRGGGDIHALLGPPYRAGGLVRRDVLAKRGELPATALVWASSFVYNGTPAQLGVGYEDVQVASPIGKLPAWHIPPARGERDCVVVVVHGHGGQRAQELRMLPALLETGAGVLYTTFRNADGAPRVGQGYLSLGEYEAGDVVAALAWAQAAGYRRAILYGFSMGGNIVLSALDLPSPLPVVGVMLDSPALEWRGIMQFQAGRYRVPRFIARPGLRLAQRIFTRRTGVRFEDVDQLAAAPRLKVPALLWQGTRDRTVPIAQADAFAAARPDLVEYHRVEGGKHIRCWNVEPEQYDAQLKGFVARVLGGDVR